MSVLSFMSQGVNSMFQVFLTGNNSEYFTLSPTAVQGRADIRMRVAMPLDYEHIRTYSFSVRFQVDSVCVCVLEHSYGHQCHLSEGIQSFQLSSDGYRTFLDTMNFCRPNTE